jgi:ABC-type branched-subunit amino acid transport system substrate-binding protein
MRLGKWSVVAGALATALAVGVVSASADSAPFTRGDAEASFNAGGTDGVAVILHRGVVEGAPAPRGHRLGRHKSHHRLAKHRAASDSTQVVVSRGQPVEIAYAPDLTGVTSDFAASLTNAVQMALEAHPAIRGFPIQLDIVNTPCGDSAADLAAATSIVANPENVGVVGTFCSTADAVALPVFQTADLVTISGSTTNPFLPPLGPSVFNSVAVSDSCCPYVDLSDPWYATVETQPSVLAWRRAYTDEFGAPPVTFADLYYDATSLLIRNLQNISSIDGTGNLVINRPALAESVRHTTKYQGVTCTTTLDQATGYRVNDPLALARCAN